MPKYKITMMKNGTDVVTVYADKANVKAAYDDAVAGAVLIFGPEEPNKHHVISVIEQLE